MRTTRSADGPSPELLRLLDGIARVVIMGEALLAAAIAASALVGRDSFLVTTRQKIVLLLVPALAAVALVVAGARLSPPRRRRLATVLVSVTVTLFAANAAVPYLVRSPTAVGALAPDGVPFDRRSLAQVIASLGSQGAPAVPAVLPTNFIRSEEARAALSARGVGFPLAAISNRTTVYCNESGEYTVYQSDQYGFQNPADAWAGRPDVLILGDSFAHGACVPPEGNVAGVLRAGGRKVVNLGMGGAGPLSQLGRIKEYARALQPADVFWFFFEGNDADGLVEELKVPALVAYLTTDGTQRLTSQQEEIDRALLDYADGRYTDAPDGLLPRGWRFLTLRRLRTALSLDAPVPVYMPEAPDPDLYRRILATARDEIASWGGRMHFVYLPAYSRYRYPAKVVPFKDDLLRSVEGLGIPTIDVVEAFEAVPDPLDLFPFRSQGHYGEAGYRLVAEAISRTLDGEHAPSAPHR